jgi:hypothetical protein
MFYGSKRDKKYQKDEEEGDEYGYESIEGIEDDRQS